MAKELKIMLGILVVVVVGIGATIFFNKNALNAPASTPVPEAVLITAQSHMTGSATAKVQLVEFGDYQCPACGVAEPIIEKIRNDYKDNPNFTFVLGLNKDLDRLYHYKIIDFSIEGDECEFRFIEHRFIIIIK